MGRQPTNGPYHWGNGPRPTWNSKHRTKKGCAAAALVLIGGALTATGALGWAAVETVKALAN